MPSYSGYAGYGDPERAKVDRARQMAELLQQGATDTSPKSFWEGAAQLGKAFIARDAMGKADQAETAYADNRKKATDLFISQMYPDAQGVAKQDLAAPAAFDLTPGAMEARQAQGGVGDKVRSMASLLGGDVLSAIEMTEKMKPPGPEYQFMQGSDGMIARGDKTSGGLEVLQPGTPKPDASEIRQVGNQIVQRQPDGSWKPVYTGSSPAETARAFQGFIDNATGEQMLVMSDGTVRGTGRNAYVPPQISSVGGVPVAVDKRTFETTELSPLENVAGNKAAVASAEVQGKAQGQVAFDLPVIEQRAQTAMQSIADLKQRNIGQRFGLQGKLYAIPGTDGADVQAVVNQVTSQAFLNAFEQLKGGGAITEREGQAATQAITRLQNQNITVGEALKAMNELEGYYRKGLEVARQRAVKAPVLPGRPAPAAGATRTREGVPFLLAKPTPAGSTLTPEEQAELEALRAEFGQ